MKKKLYVCKRAEAAGRSKFAVAITIEGKRTRKFFATAAERNKWLDSLERDGWRETLGPKMVPKSKFTSSQALEDYLRNYLDRGFSSEGHRCASDRLTPFVESMGNPLVSEIKPDDAITYISRARCKSGPRVGKLWGEKTRSEVKTSIVVFMRWCARQGLGADMGDWVELKLEKVKHYRKPPGICTVEETEALLNSIPPLYQPAMAIAFFAGIRPKGELERLTYRDFRWGESIHVSAEVAKTDVFRDLFDLPENLWTWIPKSARGPILPSYSGFTQSRRRAARRAFGWKEGTSARDGFDYPADAARHSFATFGYWRGVEWAMSVLGHTNHNTFHSNYKNNSISKADSDAYFSIEKE